jgi:hypothetical protein
MALQTSGAISLNDIHVEAGGSSGSSATINDTDIRGLIGKGSGASNSFNEYYGASATVSYPGTFTVDPEIQFAWGANELYASNGGGSTIAGGVARSGLIPAYNAAFQGTMIGTGSGTNVAFGLNAKGKRFATVYEDKNFTNNGYTNIWNGAAIQANGGYTCWFVKHRPNGGSAWHRPFTIQGAVTGYGTTQQSITSPYTGNSRHYNGIHLYENGTSYWQWNRGGSAWNSSSSAYNNNTNSIASPKGSSYITFAIFSIPANTSSVVNARARVKTRLTPSSTTVVDNLTVTLSSWANGTIVYAPNTYADGAKFFFSDSAYWNSGQATDLAHWYEFGFSNRLWTAAEQSAWMTTLETKYGY